MDGNSLQMQRRKLQKARWSLQMRKRRSVMGKRELDAAKDKVADGERNWQTQKHSLQMDRIRSIRRSKEISDGEASIAAYNTELDNGRKQFESVGQFCRCKTGLETLKSGIGRWKML